MCKIVQQTTHNAAVYQRFTNEIKGLALRSKRNM